MTFDVIRVALSGTHLIEASAGTGKTHAIATLFLRLLLEAGIDVDQILVVTFTEAAAAELRDRVRARLRDAIEAYDEPERAEPAIARLVRRRLEAGLHDRDQARLLASLHAFDEAPISTIHGFCHRVLQDRAFESGVAFDTELVVDDTAMIEEVVRDFLATQLHAADERFVRHLQDRHVGPTSLLELARLATRHAFAPIRPDGRTSAGPPPPAEAYREAYREARRLWQAHCVEVVELLSGFRHFHEKFGAAQAPLWAKSIEAFLGEEEPGASLDCAHFDRFLPETLEKYTYKKVRERGGTPRHAFFEAWAKLAQIRDVWRAHLQLREEDLRRRLALHVRTELRRRKAEAGVQSFDDLLVRLRTALEARGGRKLATAIRQRYRAALIDEFQDTDPTQFRIFDAVYRGTGAPCFFIGDPKQAIYGFRGADVFAYLGAAAGCDARHTMDTNWRSDPALLAAVERLFSVGDPFLLPGIDFLPVSARPGAGPGLWRGGDPLPAFEVQLCPRTPENERSRQISSEWAEAELPRRVAADIARLLADDVRVGGPDGRPLHAGDIAVLVRKNDQALRMQRALRALGIPGVVYGDATVFETPEAAELARVLQAVAEPSRTGRMRAAVTTELLGVTAGRLEEMLQADDDTDWNDWVEHFRRWHAAWIERGFVQMFRALLEHPGVQARVLGMVDGERRMTNLLHLGELLHEHASTEHLGPEGVLRWLGEQIRRPPRLADTFKLRLERDDEAVQLVTVHRSKGLEYPVVYCPYLWDGALLFQSEEDFLVVHDPDDAHTLRLDVRIKGGRQEKDRDAAILAARHEKRAENLRLCYVALTRARHRCVVTWGGFWHCEQSPLGYLLHAPTERTISGPEAVAAAIKEADDAALAARVRERGEGVWTVRALPEPTAPPRARAPMDTGSLGGRRPGRRIDRVRAVSSFTHLAASPSAATASWDEARDHDEHAAPPLPEAGLAQAGALGLLQFPRGARTGNFFHDVLEHIDFAADDAAIEALVTDRLVAHGLPVEPLSAMATAAVADVLRTPLLPEGAPRLSDIPATERRAELEFMLPVALGTDTALAMTREGLARAFADHSRGLPSGYAARIEDLHFAPLRGHLKGFIDLVFRHDGRWWVVDYKTNDLGDASSDYAPERLSIAMAEHHYLLQSHLYTLALCRHLGRQPGGFDYERDFGGIAYLFVRGMSRETGASRGVFIDRPPAGRIAALSRLMEGGK
jgi:exodeoxyribonuclease V beta subunit